MALNQVTVQPNTVAFRVPSEGKKGLVRLKISNNDPEAQLTFKLKLTNPAIFAVGPPYGYIKPKAFQLVKVRPKKFTDTNSLVPTDHFTVLVGVAPAIEAPVPMPPPHECWKKGGDYEPLTVKKFVVNIIYCNSKSKLPPVISLSGQVFEGVESTADKGDDDDPNLKEVDNVTQSPT